MENISATFDIMANLLLALSNVLPEDMANFSVSVPKMTPNGQSRSKSCRDFTKCHSTTNLHRDEIARSNSFTVVSHGRTFSPFAQHIERNVRMNESPTFSTEPNMFADRWRRLYCSICTNYRGQIIDGQRIQLGLHQFPINDQLRKKWIIPSVQITRKSRLCSAHFTGGVYDSMNAVPSIFIVNGMERFFIHNQPLQEINHQDKTGSSSSVVDMGTSIGKWLSAASVYGGTTNKFVYHLFNIHAKYCITCAALSSCSQGLVPQAPVTEESTTLENIIKEEHNYCMPSNTEDETECLTPEERTMPPSARTAYPSTESYQLSESKSSTNPSTNTYGCATAMTATNPYLDTFSIPPSVTVVNQPPNMYSLTGSTSIGVANSSLDTYKVSPLVIPLNQASDLHSHIQMMDTSHTHSDSAIVVTQEAGDQGVMPRQNTIAVRGQESRITNGTEKELIDSGKVEVYVIKRLGSKSLEEGQKSDDLNSIEIIPASTSNTLVSGSDGYCGTAQRNSAKWPYYEEPLVIPTTSAQVYIDVDEVHTADDADVYSMESNHLEEFVQTKENLADLASYIAYSDLVEKSSQPTTHQCATAVAIPGIAANTTLMDEAAIAASDMSQDSDSSIVAAFCPYTQLIPGSLTTDAPLPDSIPIGTSPKGAHPRYNTSYRYSKVPVSCPHCQKTLSSLQSLSVHLNYHNKNHRFTCSVCGKANSSRTDLEYHMHVHTNIKTFECSVCLKKLCRPDSLKQHMKLHLGVKDMPCLYCDEVFVAKSHLRYHCIKVHSIGVMHVTKEIPSVCEYCGMKFKSRGGLRVHYNTHDEIPKPKVCSHCGKKFANFASLIHHISNTHGTPAPRNRRTQRVVCHMCGTTLWKDNFRKHIKRCEKKKKENIDLTVSI